MTYIFIVDTNAYSGNFEREMCAYITGQVGECEVGEELVDDAISPLFDNIIERRADEHGCYRPCEIYPTLGRWNNGSGCHFDDDQFQGGHKYPAYESVAIYFSDDPREHIDLMKDRAEQFAEMMRNGLQKRVGWVMSPEPKFKVTGFRMIVEQTRQEEISV